MMTKVSPPSFEHDAVEFVDIRCRSLSGPADRKLLRVAILAAASLHAALLVLPLPEGNREAPRQEFPQSPRISRTVLPLPPIEPVRVERRTFERRIPLPAVAPEDPGPIPERRVPVSTALDAAIALEPLEWQDAVVPVPPPGEDAYPPVPDGLVITMPVLIPETKLSPVYPSIARAARREGQVILSAIIERDGSVREVRVLRATPADFGFESAAIDAVREWRYEPAIHDGRPIAVSFTIHVSFHLR